ncbi:MAG: hypothetical protein RLZZ524_226 [Pseudomonadota bacterium]|jgi:hypothetical protein
MTVPMLPQRHLRHLVTFRYKPGIDPATLADAHAAFCALPAQIPGILAFEHGADVSPEGLGQGYGHVYLMSFVDEAARDAYLVHPAHQAFVAGIGPLLDAALVLDYQPQTVACGASA